MVYLENFKMCATILYQKRDIHLAIPNEGGELINTEYD